MSKPTRYILRREVEAFHYQRLRNDWQIWKVEFESKPFDYEKQLYCFWFSLHPIKDSFGDEEIIAKEVSMRLIAHNRAVSSEYKSFIASEYIYNNDGIEIIATNPLQMEMKELAGMIEYAEKIIDLFKKQTDKYDLGTRWKK